MVKWVGKVKNNYLRASVKNKLIIIFTIITSLVIIVFSFNAYQFSQQSLNQKTEQILTNNVEIISTQINTLLEEMNSYAKLIASDEQFQQVLKESKNYDNSQSFLMQNEMKAKLNKILLTNKYIDIIQVCDTQKNNYFSYYPSENDQENPYDFYIPQSNSKQYVLKFGVALNIKEPNRTLNNAIIFHYRINDVRTGKKIGNVNIIVNETKLSNYLSQYKLHENDRISIIDNSNTIIVDTGKELYKKIDELYSNKQLEKLKRGEVVKDQLKLKKISVIDHEWVVVQEMSLLSIQKELKQLIARFVLLTCFSVFLIISIVSIACGRIIEPIQHLSRAMKNVAKGDLDCVVFTENIDEIGTLVNTYNLMLRDIKQLMQQVVDEQQAKRRYEYLMMQAQINPHFLYNTLETICGMAQIGENEKIIQVVSSLAIFYRKMLSRGANIILLRDELAITKSYLDILQLRFDNAFEYNIDVEEEIMDCHCLKLLLQPLVENSIQHGFKRQLIGGVINIEGYREADNIIVMISDNGCGLNTAYTTNLNKYNSNKNSSFGLQNINDRLQIFFGESYGLLIEPNYPKGTKVVLTMPFEYSDRGEEQ